MLSFYLSTVFAHTFFARSPSRCLSALASLLLFALTLFLSTSCGPASGDPVVAMDGPATLSDDERNKFLIRKTDPFPAKMRLKTHYPASNEYRIDLFRDKIRGLGGGYIGVGTDQNFTFVAWARSELVWLIDFDPVIVAVNRIHLLFLEKARSYADFKSLWSRANRKKSFALVKARFGKRRDFNTIIKAWRVAHRGQADVPARLRELDLLQKRFKLNSFNSNPGDFHFVRNLVLAGRIQALSGNLLGRFSLREIASSARFLGVKIRLMYTSNAEDYFRGYNAEFRQNIKSLPTDERSLIIRTVSYGTKKSWGFPSGEKYSSHPLHYNFQRLENFKAWLARPGYFNIVRLMRQRSHISKGFTEIRKLP